MSKNLILFLILAFPLQTVDAVECIIAGCNNELCVSKTDNTIFSTCLWKAQYECYIDLGICEANAQGQCGWKQTDELVACIKQAQYEVADADRFSD